MEHNISSGVFFLTYKDYTASVEYDEEANAFYGVIQNLHDIVTFQSESVEGLQQAFEDSVEDYLDFCKGIADEFV